MIWFSVDFGAGFFDLWSAIHLVFWVLIASFLKPARVPIFAGFFACCTLALGWECLEVFWAFAARPDIWTHSEVWYNSWVSDLLTLPVGYFGFWMIHSWFESKQNKPWQNKEPW